MSVHTLHCTYIRSHLTLPKRVGPYLPVIMNDMTVHQHMREENSLKPTKYRLPPTLTMVFQVYFSHPEVAWPLENVILWHTKISSIELNFQWSFTDNSKVQKHLKSINHKSNLYLSFHFPLLHAPFVIHEQVSWVYMLCRNVHFNTWINATRLHKTMQC